MAVFYSGSIIIHKILTLYKLALTRDAGWQLYIDFDRSFHWSLLRQ